MARALDTTVEYLAPLPKGTLTLKQIRQRLGRTQKATAVEVGVSSQMVSRVEAGTYGVSEPARWAAAYGLTEREWATAHEASRADRRRRIRAQKSDGGGE